eukprot:NODE_3647_length_2004_cov_10.725093.p1 GENE.NODE_3647_length_2004_cov_10.725093~~NODE_3647_length_2004_cov_10.725093.p1  ORF type:complete len:544 (+),score=85.55 NODE_3647_length_2004_cov_10.725093:160-1791(+)
MTAVGRIDRHDGTGAVASKVWHLYGRAYDLEPFLQTHPGGDLILRLTRREDDVTALFESCHAMANLTAIRQQLEQYQIHEPYDDKPDGEQCVVDDDVGRHPPTQRTAPCATTVLSPSGGLYAFEHDGFYHTVCRRVKAHFAGTRDSPETSVTHHIKANRLWAAVVALQCVAYVLCVWGVARGGFALRVPAAVSSACGWLSAVVATVAPAWVHTVGVRFATLFGPVLAISMPSATNFAPWACGALGGHLLFQLGFNVQHAGSHFSLARGQNLNMRASRIMTGWAQWNHGLWMYHHTYRHHTHTGDPKRDPDVVALRPLLSKRRAVRRYMISGLTGVTRDAVVLFIYGVFLGQYFIQAFGYWATWFRRGYMCRMKYPAVGPRGTDDVTTWWEYGLMAASMVMHFCWWRSPCASLAYVIAANSTYALCVIPDHDMFTTVMLNNDKRSKLNNGDSRKMDWGEMQVCETGNFITGKYLDLFCHLFGGMNYHIEHHLFPTVCSVHYPDIAPIVRRTCAEFGLPYYNCPSLTQAVHEFLQTVAWAQKDEA